MKKKIIIGFAITTSLLYFGISCSKKENTNTTSELNTPDSRLRPQGSPTTAGAKINPDQVTASHDIYYKEQLLDIYRSLFLLNEHLNLPFLEETVKSLSVEDQKLSRNIITNILEQSIFDDKRIKIINSTSTIYELLVTANTNITYQELYYKLSKTIDNIYELKTIVSSFIESIKSSQLSDNAKNKIINGINTDLTKGFIGFQKIFDEYNNIKFLKINKSKEVISRSEWTHEINPIKNSEALQNPNIVTFAHFKLYKEQLLTAYNKILKVDNHLKIPFLGRIVNKFSAEDIKNYQTLEEAAFKEKKFDTKRIEIINSTSTLYKLLVTENANMTYQELYYNLSKVVDELSNLKMIVHDFNRLLPQPNLLSANARTMIINGTHTDSTKGFIGFKKVLEIYDSIVFTKINPKDTVITAADWKKEQ
ncbi:hypothetical protein [Spirobacillus cienkowskii]|uniref:hypothetical protein n=1 Tax=Spirobacillus cienkowskii TaxID=495820 RepID=UPI0030D2C974